MIINVSEEPKHQQLLQQQRQQYQQLLLLHLLQDQRMNLLVNTIGQGDQYITSVQLSNWYVPSTSFIHHKTTFLVSV